MSPEEQIILWGLAACLPLMLNSATHREPDAKGLAGMILLIWSFGRLMGSLYSFPECMALNPLVDSVAGATAFTAYASHKRAWKLLLTGLYLFQVVLALSFWLAWPTPGSLYTYIYWNNLAFAGQLLCVASPGGAHAGSWMLSRVLNRSRPLHMPRIRS